MEGGLELLEEGHVGATQWGNAGQTLKGYENVREASVREMMEGWEGLLLFV